MQHDRPATYRLFQTAAATGDVNALDVAMLAGTYRVTVGAVRGRIAAHPNGPWTAPVSACIAHLHDDDTVGRFRQLQNAWNSSMIKSGARWAAGVQQLSAATTPRQMMTIGRRLQALQGAGRYQLGQVMHLLKPEWFAIVNRQSRARWQNLGFDVGGLDALERISRRYRRILDQHNVDFNIIDDILGA